MHRRLTQICAVVALVAAAAVTADVSVSARGSRGERKLDQRLQRLLREDAGDAATRRVIVRVKPHDRAKAEALLRGRGDRVRRFHGSISAFTVDARRLRELADADLVESISTDAPLRAHQTAALQASAQAVRTSLGVSTQWTGTGIGVAVIDSGIEPNADLQGKITAFYDFTRGGIAVAPFDDYGHGTHVAGLIAGSGTLSGGAFRGVAPGAHLVGLKVLDSTGQGVTSNVIAAIEFVVANRAALNVRVINLSLGHPPYESAATDPLVQAVEAATRAGVIVVASAGNYGRNATTGQVGYGGIASPGTAPSAITVGSAMTQDTVTRGDDRINTFSSRGPSYYDGLAKPDIVAPGYRLVATAAKASTLYANHPQLRVAGAAGLDYLSLSGTSMAAAVASGIVADLLQASRTANGGQALSVNGVKAVLQHTAIRLRDDQGLNYDHLTQGAGSLNAAGALRLGGALRVLSAVNSPWIDSLLGGDDGASTIGGESLTWSSAVVWGNAVIWGNTLSLHHAAWGSAVVWGNDAVVWGNGVVWGNNVVWDNPALWGSAVVWGNAVLEGNAVIWGNNAPSSVAGSSTWGNSLLGDVP